MEDSEVQVLNFLIVTDTAFVEHSLVSKHISLTSLALAEAVENGLGNRVYTISDSVDAAISVPHNLVAIGTVAKVQSGTHFQKLTALDGLQRTAHRIGQPLGCVLEVALGAGPASHIANPGKLTGRTPS